MHRTATVDLPNGIRIEYDEVGAGDRPFVLVHGFTGSRDDFRDHLATLGERGRTVALDQRGHGGSTNTGDPATYTFDQLANDLLAALEELDAWGCDLLGHSMGGMVALRATLAKPDAVNSLVLMDTAARSVRMLPEAALEGVAKLARSAGMQTLANAMRHGAQANGAASPAAQRTVDAQGFDVWWIRIEAKLLAMDPEAFAALGRSLGEQESVVGRLGEIRCPTTIIVGTEDKPFFEASKELHAGIPESEFIAIPDAAHSPQMENSDAWLQAIRGHLDRARAGS